MTTETAIRAWVEATRPTDWYGKCAGLTDRVVAVFTGGGRQWYDSATDARLASGPLNPDPALCPPGGIHYWDYYGSAYDGSYGNWGHVTVDIRGGGTDTLSATGFAHEDWGVHAGLISVHRQSSRGMTYLGWATTYGNAAPLTITTEGDDVLNHDDKTYIREVAREEIGAALSQFADAYKDQDWVREAIRQEIGGALSGFTDQIAQAVAERIGS